MTTQNNYMDHFSCARVIKDEQVLTHEQQRLEIAAQVEQFLKSGGTITVYDSAEALAHDQYIRAKACMKCNNNRHWLGSNQCAVCFTRDGAKKSDVDKGLITRAEAIKILDVTRECFDYRFIKRNKLTAVKSGRTSLFKKHEILTLKQQREA